MHFSQRLTCTELGDVSKRHCSGGNWAYQRVVSGNVPASHIRPVIHPSKPSNGHKPTLTHTDVGRLSEKEHEQRQFYMSRRPPATGPESPVQANKKRRYSGTVFIERDMKKQGTTLPATQGGPARHTVSTQEAAAPPLPGAEEMDIDGQAPANEPRALKKPGKSSRVKQPTGAEKDKDTPPDAPAPAPLPRFHGDMDKVASEMSAWTVNEIQRNLDDLEQQQQEQQAAAAASPSRPGSRDTLRFQPRVPARRYAERHPLQQGVVPVANAPVGDTMTVDAQQDADGDWVEVVYHRVPASTIDATIPREDIGVIVFEDDEEKEYFYEATDNDSDENFEDEDDENGMFASPPAPFCFSNPPSHPPLSKVYPRCAKEMGRRWWGDVLNFFFFPNG